jgi:hypothetical protein
MSKAWAGGSTRQWRRVRAAVLAHNRLPKRLGGNDGLCVRAIPDVCTGQATQVHHTLGRAVTGDDPRYLEATCAPCNQHIGEPRTHEPQPKIRSRWAR